MSESARTLGRYRILGELGRGAMGVVYKAEDPMLSRTVAIKTINMVADPQERAEYEKRFYQEAKAAGGLSHPNVVMIYDIGHAGDVVYMAMEYVEGTEFRDLLLRGRPELGAAIDIAAQVAEGLAYAHARGVVHRDVKPANIMVPRDGPAKIMDFGIARMRASDVKTQTGMLLGSPKYMAPEQLLGGTVDQRCDIFALGVVLYEALVGAPPFSGSDITQIMYQIVHATPPPPSAVSRRVPPMLDLIVAKTLAKDPAARYQDARELAADLRACRAALTEAAPDDDEETITLPPACTSPAAADTAPTLRLDAAQGVTSAAPQRVEPGLRLRISRRFDSQEATRRLASMTGAGAATGGFAKTMKLDLVAAGADRASTSPSAVDRAIDPAAARPPTRARERWILVASVTIAALIALAIALG
ncbi:MAG TPA: protein kinase [Burkholderiales bacterium]|nr:protein kinase [Burkholderiales bacterium]